MVTAASVEAFVSQKRLALVGASRSGSKMGNVILRELTSKGYTVYPVHPEAQTINDAPAFASLGQLPEPVGGAIVCVKPERAEQVVREAKEAGIERVWLQQGGESQEAIAFCESNGVDAITKECILMFAEPVESIHRFHRFFKRLFGRMPTSGRMPA